MTTRNMTCVGTHCEAPHGELRVYHRDEGRTKDGGYNVTNIILCRACWEHENNREGKHPVNWNAAPRPEIVEFYSGE